MEEDHGEPCCPASPTEEHLAPCSAKKRGGWGDCGADIKPCPPPPVVAAEPPPPPNVALLPPDHPLLEGFQRSLRDYLQRTKQQLSYEIDELMHELNEKEQRRIDEGVKLYDMQRQIMSQHHMVDECVQQIEANVANRLQKEEEIAALRHQYDSKAALSKEQKMAHNKRMVELEHVQILETNMRQWLDDMEIELKNAKRVVSRDAQLQQQLSDDKRKSDMLFYHLDMEVKKREAELAMLRDEHVEMTGVLDVINTSISNSNADLEALQSEQKRLTQAWSDVIIAIQHRDKILFQVNEATDKQLESIKLSNASIEAIRKQIAREMVQNQKLESFKQRLANDFTNLKRECQKQTELLTGLETKLKEIPLWLEQTEQDFQEAKREGNAIDVEMRRVQFKLDRHFNRKFAIEEDILKLAQDQLITDKASEYRTKLLRNAQERRRTLDYSLAQCQNQLAETLLDLERTKSKIFQLSREQDTLNVDLQAAETTADYVANEMKNIQAQVDSKLNKIDKLSHHLDTLVQATQGAEMSPTELKIKSLEKVLQGAEHQIREHQQFWLMLQNHYVNLSHKRQSQLNEIQVTNKQLSIIKQKTLKVDYELEQTEETIRTLEREIQQYTTRVEQLNVKMFKKRKDHEAVEHSCELEHQEMISKLREHEMQVLSLESDINELQNDIEHYKDLVLDKHRDSLSWETKYKLIEETLRWRKEETENRNSEIGRMKAEIHRMQIRHNQLKRAQEKLSQDLKHCVMHREQIYVAVSTKQFLDSRPEKLRSSPSTAYKIQDIRNKLKQVQNEIDNLRDHVLNETNQNLKELRQKNEEMLDKIAVEIEEGEKVQKEIEEGVLQKVANLENIVRKQNRAKSYRRLSGATLPYKIPRSEMTIEQMMQKQLKIIENLSEVLQTLATEYPEKKCTFNKLLQMIKE